MENTRIGPYRVLNKLGNHRRHQVYKAIEVERGRKVALKLIKCPKAFDHAAALAKLRHEAKILGHIRHAHLTNIYNVHGANGKLFFVHELVDGENLSALLQRRGHMTIDMVVDFGRQLTELLEFLHSEELPHGKLMTEKILVRIDGQIKVTDLRLNRPYKRRWDAPARPPMDAAAYLAPEQLETGIPSYKGDLYSLGIILFEMLTGSLPFEPQNFTGLKKLKRELRPPSITKRVLSCPGWLDELVTSLLEPDPKKRPHSITAVRLKLEQIHNIEINKKAAVEELAGGFTVLAAGKDKREARRLLGIKQKSQKPRGPLLQNFAFLIAGLVVVALFVTAIKFWPSRDTESELQTAAHLLDSSDHADWNQARTIANKIRKGSYYPPEQVVQANDIYFEARTKSLRHTAENGIIGLERKEIRTYCSAYQMEKDGKLGEAMIEYKVLIDTIAPDGEQRYILQEAQSRYVELQRQKNDADEQSGGAWLSYDEAIAKIDAGQTEHGIEILQTLVERYGKNHFMHPFNSRVAAKLQQLAPNAPAPSTAPTDKTDAPSPSLLDPSSTERQDRTDTSTPPIADS